ncbi:DNA repair protein RecN [bacterium HR17]|uniref:DNA repair protein RecN n=1 Tax=Candidatus Fervidibacter japonicus TaxID=2035412 RepID=A0A2H5XD50_9BACT|nr:DNA repair protein RecN [bacterium HR17]
MLTELLIRNLAVIDEVQVPFQPGFNVLTGETGAGKSIIIHALSFLVGERGDPDLIRTGADTLLVEAVFDLGTCPQVRAVIAELGVELDDDTLIVARELHRSGRSRCRLNGRAATLAMLRLIGKAVLDIHGQHEHQSLLDPANHLRFLDAFGGETVTALKERYIALYRQLQQVERELTDLQRSERERIQRLDLLRYQADEIDRANLRDGEEEELVQERQRLVNAERIAERIGRAVDRLTGDGGALDALGDALHALKEVADFDPALQAWHETLMQTMDSAQEVAFALERYARTLEFDPDRLEEVESRLDLLRRLKRKYGDNIAAILRYRSEITRELERLESSEEHLERLQQERDRLRAVLAEVARELSEARHDAAERMAKAVQAHLKALMMERAKFKVAINHLPDPDGLPLPDGTVAFGRDGVDRVEFLIATNPGEPLKPLAKIASGGELARTMLALKASLPRTHEIPVLVFDEVDVGIGGRTAEAVGEKLREVARYAQVLCVTHLPQIAALADWHLQVRKVDDGQRSRVVVTPLHGDARVQEVARMLSGKQVTPTSLQHARELLQRAARATAAARGG